MQFEEMKDVLPNVDTSMISRVKDWLLSKRDGKGSFNLKKDGLDSFSSPPADIADAYILWALTQIGEAAGLEKEIDTVVKRAESSDDSYLIALVSLIL